MMKMKESPSKLRTLSGSSSSSDGCCRQSLIVALILCQVLLVVDLFWGSLSPFSSKSPLTSTLSLFGPREGRVALALSSLGIDGENSTIEDVPSQGSDPRVMLLRKHEAKIRRVVEALESKGKKLKKRQARILEKEEKLRVLEKKREEAEKKLKQQQEEVEAKEQAVREHQARIQEAERNLQKEQAALEDQKQQLQAQIQDFHQQQERMSHLEERQKIQAESMQKQEEEEKRKAEEERQKNSESEASSESTREGEEKSEKSEGGSEPEQQQQQQRQQEEEKGATTDQGSSEGSGEQENKAEEHHEEEKQEEKSEGEEQKVEEQQGQNQQEEPKEAANEEKQEASSDQPTEEHHDEGAGEKNKEDESAGESNQGGEEADKCKGRRIFIYDSLPAKFNQDLISNCGNPCDSHCVSLCPAVDKDGLGMALESYEQDNYEDSTYSFAPWLGTQPNMVGVIFRARMGQYECRTWNWEEADAFYVPALFGLLTLYGRERPWKEIESLGDELEEYLKDQPGFARRGGKDHFLVIGQGMWEFFASEHTNPEQPNKWTTYLYKRPALANVTFISVERLHWEGRTQSIPYATAFHPSNMDEVNQLVQHVRAHPRPRLASIVGTRMENFPLRHAVVSACEGRGEKCLFVDCGDDCPQGACRAVRDRCSEPRFVAKKYMESEFCLMPNGGTATRRGIFDAMLAGCIPVLFDTSSFIHQYPWHKGAEGPNNLSVTFDSEGTKEGKVDFLAELEKIPAEERSRMRESILRIIPQLVYQDHTKSGGHAFKDAFDYAVEGILQHLVTPVQYPSVVRNGLHVTLNIDALATSN